MIIRFDSKKTINTSLKAYESLHTTRISSLEYIFIIIFKTNQMLYFYLLIYLQIFSVSFIELNELESIERQAFFKGKKISMFLTCKNKLLSKRCTYWFWGLLIYLILHKENHTSQRKVNKILIIYIILLIFTLLNYCGISKLFVRRKCSYIYNGM